MYFGLLAGRSRAGKSVESVAAVFRRRGLRYLALALVDVEAAYLMQRAMQYTTLVSVQVGGGPQLQDLTRNAASSPVIHSFTAFYQSRRPRCGSKGPEANVRVVCD